MNAKVWLIAATGLLVWLATGCRQQESAASDDFKRKWNVCALKQFHMKKNDKFELVEVPNHPGRYVIAATDGTELAEGWASLILTPVGTEETAMSPATWPSIDCKKEQDSGLPEYEPSEQTLRLRGATCLPSGIPNHVEGTCSTDTTGSHGKKYHEIFVFARPVQNATEVPHVYMEHCGRDEMIETIRCDLTACATEEARCPHPGHVHGDP